jgi:hypothetical protein
MIQLQALLTPTQSSVTSNAILYTLEVRSGQVQIYELNLNSVVNR